MRLCSLLFLACNLPNPRYTSLMSGKPNILIVDDSNTIRRTVELLLAKQGYKVSTAVDGYAAFQAISQNPPDLIFLDVQMDTLGGLHTCQVIKSNPRYKHIPVIMLTGNDKLVDRAKARHSGADFLIGKPFTLEDLVAVIKKYLEPAAA